MAKLGERIGDLTNIDGTINTDGTRGHLRVIKQQRVDTLALILRQDTGQVEIHNFRLALQGLQ